MTAPGYKRGGSQPAYDATTRAGAIMAALADERARAPWLLCDRHSPDSVAFRVVDDRSSSRDLTFGDLSARSRAAACVLHERGVRSGDRAASLLTKGVDLITFMLGAWRLGAVYVPLFTAFAPPAIRYRLGESRTTIVLTDAGQRHKLEAIHSGNNRWSVLVTNDEVVPTEARFDQLVDAKLAQSSGHLTDDVGDPLMPNAELVHMFTSGTTGAPKGARQLDAELATGGPDIVRSAEITHSVCPFRRTLTMPSPNDGGRLAVARALPAVNSRSGQAHLGCDRPRVIGF